MLKISPMSIERKIDGEHKSKKVISLASSRRKLPARGVQVEDPPRDWRPFWIDLDRRNRTALLLYFCGGASLIGARALQDAFHSVVRFVAGVLVHVLVSGQPVHRNARGPRRSPRGWIDQRELVVERV